MIDLPHVLAKSIFAMNDLALFVDRYQNAHNAILTAYSNAAMALDVSDKKSRDNVIAALLKDVNIIIIGNPDTQPWPLVDMNPYHIGLAFRHEMLNVMMQDDVGMEQINLFINKVYFPALVLTDLQKILLEKGKDVAWDTDVVNAMAGLCHQAACLRTSNALNLPKETDVKQLLEQSNG
ncbi:hypothetical protein AH06_180 [Erwinia phage AH06]|nr:hypothetical protein AH06_180 [Erwinia phage AH06]